jgi:uncharacterized protein (TIGR03086 family)
MSIVPDLLCGARVSRVDPIMALERATSSYRQRLTAIGPDSWSSHSVCDAWTLRDIADHVTGGNRFAVGLLAGHSAREAIGTARGLGFDDDPLSSYDTSAAAQLDAFRAPRSLDMVVHHPAGDIDGRQFLGFRLGDLLLHGWDLARSTGGDESLDPKLVPLVWDAYQPSLGAAGKHRAFGEGASGRIPADAPLALRLLDLTGRRR